MGALDDSTDSEIRTGGAGVFDRKSSDSRRSSFGLENSPDKDLRESPNKPTKS